MAGRLENKVVLITGAGGGLGSEQVKLMAKEGAKIVAANLQEDPIIASDQPSDGLWKRTVALVDEINQHGGEAMAIALDVTQEQDWIDAISETEKRFGRLDVLVNNAGIYYHAGLLEHTVEKFYQIVNINQLGVLLGMKSAAMEFVGDNIRVNAICPGMFDTNLFESSVPQDVWDPLISLVPMKRFGKPHEIAYGTIFLASDESSFMTGTDLVIDGGYTCQ